SGRKLQSCVTPNVGIGMAASTALMPRGPWQHGVSKVIQPGGAVRAVWNVLRDAASALRRTRGLGVTKLRKGGAKPMKSLARAKLCAGVGSRAKQGCAGLANEIPPGAPLYRSSGYRLVSGPRRLRRDPPATSRTSP